MKNFMMGVIILPITTIILIVLLVPLSFTALILEHLHRGVSLLALILGNWISANNQASTAIKEQMLNKLEGEDV